nr:MAG TPA: hypothetical protein [Caudoviricetes sp.]
MRKRTKRRNKTQVLQMFSNFAEEKIKRASPEPPDKRPSLIHSSTNILFILK